MLVCSVFVGSYSSGGVSLCVGCPANTYSISNGSSVCVVCDESGIICANGLPYAAPGYWTLITSPSTGPSSMSSSTVSAFVCPAGFCTGAASPGVALCANNRLQSPNNILCGVCLPDYVDWNGECVCKFTHTSFVSCVCCVLCRDLIVSLCMCRLSLSQWQYGVFGSVGFVRLCYFNTHRRSITTGPIDWFICTRTHTH